MFGMSKIVAERSAAAAEESEVESALPLQTSVSQYKEGVGGGGFGSCMYQQSS
jgi:hypothetical protein